MEHIYNQGQVGAMRTNVYDSEDLEEEFEDWFQYVMDYALDEIGQEVLVESKEELRRNYLRLLKGEEINEKD